jgi:MFS family permease
MSTTIESGNWDRKSLSQRAASRSAIKSLLPLNLIIFLGFMTIGMSLPVLPIFVHAAMTASPLIAGTVVGLQSITTVLTRRYAGAVADLKGPKTATVRGLVICTSVGFIYIFTAAIPASWIMRLAVLLTGRIVLGLGESLILTGAITWGIGSVGEVNAGQVMSWNGVAMYGAYAIGAPAGLVIYGLSSSPYFGFLELGAAAALLPLIALGIATFIPGVGVTPGRHLSVRLVLGYIWPFGATLTLQMVGFGTIASFLSLTYGSLGWRGAGLGFTGFGIAVIVIRLLCGSLPDRLGGIRVETASLFAECVGQSLIWIAHTPGAAAAGAIITGIGVALAFPALGIEAMKRVPPANKGLVVALFSAFQDVAFGITGPVTGLVATAFGYQSVFAVGAISAVAALLLLILTGKENGV